MSTVNAEKLAAILSPQQGPVLTWFHPRVQGEADIPRERIELGGAVARRWVAKTDNFLANEFPFGATSFTAFLSPHWRTPFWLLTCWLRGLELQAPGSPVDDLALSNDLDFLLSLQDEGGPDMLVAQTTDSYAFSWPDELPFGITDGIADVMSYGDEVEMPYTAEDDAPLLAEDASWLPPGLEEDPDKQGIRVCDLAERDYLGIDDSYSSDLTGERALVTTADIILASVQIFQLWMRGATVVWVPGGEKSEEIANSERVTLTVPPVPPAM